MVFSRRTPLGTLSYPFHIISKNQLFFGGMRRTSVTPSLFSGFKPLLAPMVGPHGLRPTARSHCVLHEDGDFSLLTLSQRFNGSDRLFELLSLFLTSFFIPSLFSSRLKRRSSHSFFFSPVDQNAVWIKVLFFLEHFPPLWWSFGTP